MHEHAHNQVFSVQIPSEPMLASTCYYMDRTDKLATLDHHPSGVKISRNRCEVRPEFAGYQLQVSLGNTHMLTTLCHIMSCICQPNTTNKQTSVHRQSGTQQANPLHSPHQLLQHSKPRSRLHLHF